MASRPNSFTCRNQSGISKHLVTPVNVGIAFDPAVSGIPPVRTYIAVWDTGATASAISEKVINELGLKEIGMTKALGADGEYDTPVFLVNLIVPNGVSFPALRVTRGKLRGIDVLVGMDVITQGDFAVSNHNGHTTFSFRVPSQETIDFTGKAVPPIPLVPQPPHYDGPKVGRNDPCPCGSGKKFKKCCGR